MKESTEYLEAWGPHGKAIEAYWKGNKEATIGIRMDDGEITKMPASIYFRKEEELVELEQFALSICRGNILDVGAGAGCHSLILQEAGLEVTAIDIAEEGVAILKERGIRQSFCTDFLDYEPDHQFDSLLFLMNGIGIAGNLQGLSNYLNHAHKLTVPDGQIILDSSDLRDNDYLGNAATNYVGEVNYQMQFEHWKGAPYQWLYVDPDTLIEVSKQCEWNCQIIYESEDGSYLARLLKVGD